MSDRCELGPATCIRRTDKALCCSVEDLGEIWVPVSVIHDDSEVYDSEENNVGELIVKLWWAEKEGYT